jgi:hypothetical protein
MLQTGIEVFNSIKSEIAASQKSIFLASAYCTKKAFDSLNSAPPRKNVKKVLVVRWEPYDLLQGSSDLEVYLSAKNLGWKVFINQRLHAKTAIFDDVRVIIGSANYTESGMGLHGLRSNLETVVQIPCTSDFLAWQDELIQDSIEVTDELYELISKEIASFEPEFKLKIAFSFTQELQHKMRESQGALFTNDFVFCKVPQLLVTSFGDDVEHDLKLLGLTVGASIEQIAVAFSKLKIYRWIEENLQSELYFGQFSAVLHNALQDDPKPYRQNVKSLVANIIEWLTILYPEKFKQERPNYSTKIVRL